MLLRNLLLEFAILSNNYEQIQSLSLSFAVLKSLYMLISTPLQ